MLHPVILHFVRILEKPFGKLNHKVQKPPKDKRPVGAMPDTGQEPYDKHIVHHKVPVFHAASAKREINIFTKPVGQGYMPPLPEILD